MKQITKLIYLACLMALVSSLLTGVFMPTSILADSSFSYYCTLDSSLGQYYPNTNYGSVAYLYVDDGPPGSITRSIMSYDVSAQGNGTVSSAYLHVWYSSFVGTNPVGKSVDVFKVTKGNWTQSGVTWNRYTTSNLWDSAGGDYVTSLPAGGNFTIPADFGWIDIDITGLMQDAVDSDNLTLELLMKFHTEGLTPGWSLPHFNSHENDYGPYVTASFSDLPCDWCEPYGNTLDAVGVSATTATLVAEVLCDGRIGNTSCGYIEWHLEGENGDWRTIVDEDELNTGVDADVFLGNLTPGVTFNYYAMFIGGGGERMNGGIKTFTTSPRTEATKPVVWTSGATYVTGTDALLRGAIMDDGGLSCIAGISYRVKGAATWESFDILGEYFVAGDGFGYWAGLWSPALLPMTVYEYFAYAENVLGVGNGTIEEFTTSIGEGIGPTPTVTPGPGIELPPWLHFPFAINQTVKTILGIVITLIGMVLIVAVIRTSGGLFVAAAFGLGMTIVFTVIGWYSLWIILLIGAIVGLITFFIILGKR